MDAVGRPKFKVRQGYRHAVDVHVLPLIGAIEVSRVRVADVQTVLDRYAETHSPGTTRWLRVVLSGMFRFAVTQELRDVNPVASTATRTPPKPKLAIPEPDEVAAIVEAARGTRWAVPILLAAVTGCRRSEQLGLAWRDIDFDAATATVRQTLHRVSGELVLADEGKTKHAHRTIPLPAFAIERLREHRAEQRRRRLATGFAWHDLDLVNDRGDGRPMDVDLYSRSFRRIARGVGVDCRLHDLRHAWCTRMARSGLHPTEVSEVAGHASPSFTLSTYQHTTAESLGRVRAAVEAAFD
jgi:integrase